MAREWPEAVPWLEGADISGHTITATGPTTLRGWVSRTFAPEYRARVNRRINAQLRQRLPADTVVDQTTGQRVCERDPDMAAAAWNGAMDELGYHA